MNEAAQTLEGWYALHDFRSIDWQAWKAASLDERKQAIHGVEAMYSEWTSVAAQKKGAFAFYSIVGQKADFMMMHLRETLEELNELETQFNKSALAQYTYPAYSYVSVIELSNYLAQAGTDPMKNPEVVARLKPELPKTKHVCFYPMNKRREGDDNWYMLPMQQRREMMKSHGMIGRKYAGKVKQIITGSVGLDDWEWGVTLFADDAITFKKLVYEMRFDEASARYGEFGEFLVGNRTDASMLSRMLSL